MSGREVYVWMGVVCMCVCVCVLCMPACLCVCVLCMCVCFMYACMPVCMCVCADLELFLRPCFVSLENRLLWELNIFGKETPGFLFFEWLSHISSWYGTCYVDMPGLNLTEICLGGTVLLWGIFLITNCCSRGLTVWAVPSLDRET